VKLILPTLFILIVFSGCKKEFSEEFHVYNNGLNDVEWRTQSTSTDPTNEITAVLSNDFPVLLDTLNTDSSRTLKFNDSLSISLTGLAGNGTAPGTSINGTFVVKLIHLKKKGDFIRFAKPTTSFNALLHTSGAFNTILYKNGQPIQLDTITKYNIAYSFVNNTNTMRYFYEDSITNNLDTIKTWFQSNYYGGVYPYQFVDSITNIVNKGYNIYSRKLNWISSNKYNDSTLPSTSVHVKLPANFNNTNSQVYAVFNNQATIVRLKPNLTAKEFTFEKIPLNSNPTFVVISKIGNDLFLGTSVHTVINSNVINITPQTRTLNFIQAYLDSL
jgi:hypothetical protein